MSLYGLRRRRWVNFGVAPLAPPLDKAQKTARRPIGSKSIYLDDFANFSVNDSVVISPARARNLEKSAVYSLCHVEVRLMEFFSGNEAARLSTVFADYGWGATEVEIVALEARMLRHVNNMSARKQ